MGGKPVTRRCERCRREFEQTGPGPARKLCYSCRPARRKLVEAPKRRVRRLPGEPFELAHFAAWAERLDLSSGERFQLEDFQAAFIADVLRGFRECWLVCPEGQGKSTLASLIAIYFARFRREAWIPVAAASRDQAGVLFRQASGFVLRNPELAGELRVFPGYRRIACEATGSNVQVYSADTAVADGIIPSLCVVDELHRHRDLSLYQLWVGKLAKLPGSQMVAISTAGAVGSEFEALREEFRRAAGTLERDGAFVRAAGPASVMHEYALEEAADPEDLDAVKAANPFSGVTLESLAEKRAAPSWTASHWARFTCNRPGRAEEAAISEAEWSVARSERALPLGERVYAGLDIGWKLDCTALVPLWVESPDFRLLGPATVLEPPRDGRMLLADEVRHAVAELHARNPIVALVMDPSFAADIAQWAADELGLEVVARTQSNTMACADYAAFTAALRSGQLHHTGDPALTRHVLNATARVLPGGGVRFDRPRHTRTPSLQQGRVIDALTAAAMANSFAAAAPPLVPGALWL
jgi:phage terminase large subunit-like protein